MENWLDFIQRHAPYAHWYIFGAALLAGLNIPISIDLLMIMSATLAAAIIPAHLPHLFLGIYLGCLFSAWIAYWIGRKLAPQLLKWPFMSKMLNPKRMDKVKKFYEKRGGSALILGRFIPFGVRNILFMSSGMSLMPFPKFILWDAVACFLWSVTCFSIYYALGKNMQVLYSQVKWINLCIFLAFGVTVIGIFWYKKKKKAKRENV